jgi:hypothetical protein
VKSQYMRGNGLINLVFSDISHDENSIESGENRTLELNLLSGVLEVIVSTHDRVGSSED